MRIAVLGNAAVLHTRRWASGLARQGNEVRIFSLETHPAEELTRERIQHQKLPSLALPGVLRYPLAAPQLIRELQAFGPDLIDAHFVPNYGLLGALSGLHPLVVNCWGSDLLLATDSIRKMRTRWVLGRADRVYVDAMNLYDAATALGVRRERIRYQPWGVDSSLFAYSRDTEDRRGARRRMKDCFQSDDPRVRYVLSTRILDPLYDVETLIRAWPKVVANQQDVRLLIVGDGPQQKRLEALAGSQAGNETVRFVGRVQHGHLPDLLAGSEIYVSTSRSDSTSISLLEAMSCGCFPIVSDIAGNREWLDEDSAGLFAVGDAEGLAKSLVDALSGKDLDPARRVNRLRLEREADWNATMQSVLEDYHSLLSSDHKIAL